MEPLALTISETCAVSGLGRTSVYEAIRDGSLPARKRGRRTIVLTDDLRRYLETLPPLKSKKVA